VQVLESIKDFLRHRYCLGLHFRNIWFMHYGYAKGFSGLCHTFFGWNFILRHGAYWWYSCIGKFLSCFGHFVFMCCSSTFLCHYDKNFFSFIFISFGRFQQENYANMWGHYGSRVMGVYSKPLGRALGLTTNLLWCYRPFIYGGLCPIFFSKELGFGNSIFVF
jgi:hypothetical protein